MAVIVFPDVILPSRVLVAGLRGTQKRLNDRVAVDSGEMSINIVWDRTLREFEIGIVPMRREAWQDIETIHEITDGGAYGFLMLDPKDQFVSLTQGVVADITSGANADYGYQLYQKKTHAASGRSKDRKITRPMLVGFQLYISGVLQTTGYTLDVETGIVSVTSVPLAANVTWTGRFYVPVHFADDSIDWSMVAPSQDPDARFLAGPSCLLQEIAE